jgi:hypothetical protein
MIKYYSVVLLAFFFAGCSSNNEITIQNIAGGSVLVNFRAESHVIVPNNSITISDIPNGTYDYSTTFSIPAGYSGEVSGEASAGTLIFEDRNTKVNLIYSSTQTDTIYTLGCTVSSTRNLSTKSLTSE